MLNSAIVELLDSVAENEGISRSMLLGKAAMAYILDRATKIDNAEGSVDIEGQERLW